MFSVKICGITNVDDALKAAEAGATAIGLNFYRHSPRYVTPNLAADIVAALPSAVCSVGVFVDHDTHEIESLMGQTGLNMAQLHGDYDAAFAGRLEAVPILPAFRLKEGDEGGVFSFLAACRPATVRGVLVDAAVPGEYGGSGVTANWTAAARLRGGLPSDIPMVLAGGLTLENVEAAIMAVRPAAVDVASGVESSSDPTRKESARMIEFVARALRGLRSVT